MAKDQQARMLDKATEPSAEDIALHLGGSAARLEKLEAMLGDRYALSRELRFPFGNEYGWGYKYNHGKKHLLYIFFEAGAFTCTFQIGDAAVDAVRQSLDSLLPRSRETWENSYLSGKNGGWLHYRILHDEGGFFIFASGRNPMKPAARIASTIRTFFLDSN